MVINWKTSSNKETIIKYGTSKTSLSTKQSGSCDVWSDAGYSSNYYYHTIKLKGLKPDTKYYYYVKTGSDSSKVYNFHTQPSPGKTLNNSGHLRFIVMGDNQIKAQPRYDSLVSGAKRKAAQLYGDINESVNMVIMVGDQVDVGTLDHYENVHFAKNKALSPILPIHTTVGNHETYGTLKMTAYSNHFYYDSLSYKGIYSGTDYYYAYQSGRVLFISMSTEHVSTAQFDWVKKVVTAANSDTTVDFIVSLAHRPYQAEQYVGDISTWIRNTVVPYLNTSPKYVMHYGAHHHLYARGQIKDYPIYHVISGGTAWDQYWGMGTETDMDDVQKTISNWGYQIMDFDIKKKRVDVATFSIGSIYKWKNNVLIDSFHRVFGQTVPDKPSIVHNYKDSFQLPQTISTSKFSTKTTEKLNSTEFLISQSKTFSSNELDILRDYEDLYGNAGNPDTSKDQNKGVDITKLKIDTNALNNGKHYIKARHRDRNLEWSDWSDVDSFKVYGSFTGKAAITLDKPRYAPSQTITVTYVNGPGLAKDWIGLYKKGDKPGSIASTTWSYVSGKSGTLTFTLKNAGEYFAAFFTNDVYTEIASRVNFYVGKTPILSSDKSNYKKGDSVTISYKNGPGFNQDWIGVYKIGDVPGVGTGATSWKYVTDTAGKLVFKGLNKGYYFAVYLLNNAYTEASDRIYFSVGDTITTLTINKTKYMMGEYISTIWTDGAGNPKDWMGLYDSTANPNINPLLTYTYINGQPNGTKVLKDTLLPKKAGKYFLVLFTNDSYNEISNRCYFSVIDTTTHTTGIKEAEEPTTMKLYPNPTATSSVIESSYPIDWIELLNADGKTVYRSVNVDAQSFTLLNHDLPNGIYFVKVMTDKPHIYKLIIKR